MYFENEVENIFYIFFHRRFAQQHPNEALNTV